MTTATKYREYAEECLTAMRAAMIPEVRTALSTAAQRWIALADQVEDEGPSPRRPTIAAATAPAPAQT